MVQNSGPGQFFSFDTVYIVNTVDTDDTNNPNYNNTSFLIPSSLLLASREAEAFPVISDYYFLLKSTPLSLW